jgi:hypothetical protein
VVEKSVGLAGEVVVPRLDQAENGRTPVADQRIGVL